MQWLIDIVKEIIHGQLGYFDRGDPATYDFRVGDFTTDNAWHNLDLSAIVPAEAQLVLFNIRMRSPNAGPACRFRKKGNVNSVNLTQPFILVGALFHAWDISVTPDADRKIQYRISNVVWNNIDFSVRGWWLR